MNIWGGMVLRAGITWGIVAILLTILATVLAPLLPSVGGLTLGGYALLMAGVHYSARARSDLLQSALGGGLSGVLAGVFLLLTNLAISFVPSVPGSPSNLVSALIIGGVAGVAGGLGYEVIDR